MIHFGDCAICIGPVCIPYQALYGLVFFLQPLFKWLLKTFPALNKVFGGAKKKGKEGADDDGCCPGGVCKLPGADETEEKSSALKERSESEGNWQRLQSTLKRTLRLEEFLRVPLGDHGGWWPWRWRRCRRCLWLSALRWDARCAAGCHQAGRHTEAEHSGRT